MNDRNLFGRVLALVLLLAAAYGVRAIVRGGAECAGGDSHCTMEAPAVPAGGEAAPAEKPAPTTAPDEDEESKLERKAPVVPPAK